MKSDVFLEAVRALASLRLALHIRKDAAGERAVENMVSDLLFIGCRYSSSLARLASRTSLDSPEWRRSR